MSRKTQRIIIPKGSVDPTDTTVIEVPLRLQNEPVVIAKRKSSTSTSQADIYLALAESLSKGAVGQSRTRNATDAGTSTGMPFVVRTIDPAIYPPPQFSLPAVPPPLTDGIEATERTEKEMIIAQLEEYQQARRRFLQNASNVAINTYQNAPLPETYNKGNAFPNIPGPRSYSAASGPTNQFTQYGTFSNSLNTRPTSSNISMKYPNQDQDDKTCPTGPGPSQPSILKSSSSGSRNKIRFNDTLDMNTSTDRFSSNQSEPTSLLYRSNLPDESLNQSSEWNINSTMPSTSSAHVDQGTMTISQQPPAIPAPSYLNRSYGKYSTSPKVLHEGTMTNTIPSTSSPHVDVGNMDTSSLRSRSPAHERSSGGYGRTSSFLSERERTFVMAPEIVNEDQSPPLSSLDQAMERQQALQFNTLQKGMKIERNNAIESEYRRKNKRRGSKSDPYIKTFSDMEVDNSYGLLGEMRKSYDASARMGVTHSTQADIATSRSSSYSSPCGICESRQRSSSGLLSTEELESIRDQFLETRKKLEEILYLATKPTRSAPSLCCSCRSRPRNVIGNTGATDEGSIVDCKCRVSKKKYCPRYLE